MSQHTLGQHKTTVSHDDTHTIVTYHNTDVVRFNDDEIILNTGGWRTATTKTRMNQTSGQFNLGYKVFQHDGEWFVIRQDERGFYDENDPIPFPNQTLTLKR